MNILHFENPSDSNMNPSGVQTMSSREIAKVTGKRHDHVLRDCAILNEKYEKMGMPRFGDTLYVNSQNRQEYREFLLTKIQTLDLMTGYDIELRIKVNRRWEELETKQAVPQFQIPQTFAEALKLAAEKVEESEQKSMIIDEQEKQLQIQAPKVERYDQVMNSKGLLTVNMVASYLHISAVRLNKILCEWGVQYSQSGTYFLNADYRNRGLAEHKPYPYVDSTGMIKTRDHLYWTQTGKEFILNLYSKKLTVTV